MSRGRTALFFGAVNAAVFAPLAVAERRMKATGGPGIIPFELAGTPERSQRMLDTWGEEGQAAARTSLLLDFGYLVTYSGLGVVGCLAAADALDDAGCAPLAAAGGAMAAAQVAAGACDAAENTTLLQILRHGVGGGRPGRARAFARAKFALLYAVWAYGAAGLVAWRLGRR